MQQAVFHGKVSGAVMWAHRGTTKRSNDLFRESVRPVNAERTRFELAVGLPLRQFSKLLVSATHPPLQCLVLNCFH